MKFTYKDLQILGLDNHDTATIRECLEIFDDDKYYLHSVDKYFQGELTPGQELAKKFKIKFANEMFSN